MKYIGAHVSIAGGVEKAPLRAGEIGATAFAMFSKNQKRWKSPPFDDYTLDQFVSNLSEGGYGPGRVIPHIGYLINPANSLPDKRERSLNAMLDEADRVMKLGLTMLNFHPGSHLNLITPEAACKLVAEAVNLVHREVGPITMVVETTAGQGTGIGSIFEDLARIIDGVERPEYVGVCIDTCHIHAAGYDIRNEETYEKTMEEFDRILGFSLLRAVHLNDAKSDFASRVDRHSPLGEGSLGWDPFERMMRDKRFDDIPLVVETPKEELWPKEIARLKEAAGVP
jgi:deoxyribonuclease-4